ncbi:MAG: 6-phospho-alpha-glucosidase [Clostridia bacterium]|nr:6-phospho-alpha-glucosidase [Clostridia bacterium]
MKKHKVVIVGGGSTWTPGLLKSLCEKKDRFPLEELRLFDIDEQRQRVIGEYARVLFAEEYPSLNFFYTTDKQRAYEGVDFVFCQIRTGGFAMRMMDEQIPLAHGVVGQETCGPGGFAYGLRSIPDLIQIVRDARTYADDPWILNYTNPAAIVAVALERAFPGDRKIINMCDQPVNLLNSFAKVLGVGSSEIFPEYVGLNHFGWFTKLRDARGNDLLNQLKQRILSDGFLPADAAERDASWLDTYAMVQTIMRDFPDYAPNTYLQYYLYPEQVVARLDPDHPRTEEVKNGRERRVAEQCALAVKNGTVKGLSIARSEAHADMIVDVASAIANDTGECFIMITRNGDTITNFHPDAMVETCARVDGAGVTAIPFGEIDVFMKGLMEGQYAYEKLTVDAYFEGSYKKALQALTLNRTLVDATKARAVLDDLMDANQRYWPELK